MVKDVERVELVRNLQLLRSPGLSIKREIALAVHAGSEIVQTSIYGKGDQTGGAIPDSGGQGNSESKWLGGGSSIGVERLRCEMALACFHSLVPSCFSPSDWGWDSKGRGGGVCDDGVCWR